MNKALGKELNVVAIAIRGFRSEEGWREFLAKVIRAIDMHEVHSQVSWKYPVEAKGGIGETIVQPITESFVALDTWRDHNGAYLIVCSCVHFDKTILWKLITKEGLSVADGGAVYVSL